MKRFRNIISLLALGLFVASCSGGSVARQFEFDASKSYALFAFDIYFIDDLWPNYSIYLFPYDPETKTIDSKKRSRAGSGFISSRSNEGVEFYLGSIDPGTYVVGYLYYQISYSKTMTCFPEQTMRVDLLAGKITYIGEMTFTLDYPRVNTMKLEVTPHGRGHVAGRMSRYRGIDAEVIIQPIEYVSFEPGEVKGDLSCIWNYVN